MAPSGRPAFCAPALVAMLVLLVAACDAGGVESDPLDEVWALDYDAAGPAETIPLAVGDSLIVAAAGMDLVCLRVQTGEIKWRTRVSDDFSIQARSLVTDGTYVFTSQTTERVKDFRAYRLDDGQEVWRRPVDDIEIYEPARYNAYDAGGGAFYASALDGYVYAFDAATGVTRWRVLGGSGPVLYADGAVYVSQAGPLLRVTRLDVATGVVEWSTSAGEAGIGSKPILDGDAVVVLSDSLYRFEAATGRRLLTAPTLGDAEPSVPDAPWLYGSAESPWKQNLRTGEFAWVSDYRANGNNDALLGGRLYHAVGGLAVFDAETGALVHDEPPPGASIRFVVSAGGLVVAQSAYRLTAYRPSGGSGGSYSVGPGHGGLGGPCRDERICHPCARSDLLPR